MTLVSGNGNRCAEELKDATFDLESSESYSCQGKLILDWTSIGEFLDNGKLSVEAKINVLENVGEGAEEDEYNEIWKQGKELEKVMAYMTGKMNEFENLVATVIKPSYY